MLNLLDLDWIEFELLIGLLLRKSGFEILKTPPPPGRPGPDYEVLDADGVFYCVDIKHFKGALPTAGVARFIHEIERIRESKPDTSGILVTSSRLSKSALKLLADHKHINVWDGEFIQELLGKHPDIADLARPAANARSEFMHLQESLLSPLAKSKSDGLIDSLKSIAPGKDSWRQFENVCVEILSYVFSPALGAPDIQSRSDDGLDILDAIFPIRSRDYPWSYIRSEHGTRFVVAEFKNYTDPIGQKQVESLVQYLWQPAKRNFGLLVSRTEPSDSAVSARRRAWLESEKCIVFLSDDDLVEMLQTCDSDVDPFNLIDIQLEYFFRSLTP